MKRIHSITKITLAGLLVMSFICGPIWATPSTTYWTPCTIDFQAYKVGHITYDNYTTIGKMGTTQSGSAFPNDLGLTVGILPFEKFQMEVGMDMQEPLDYPWSFNAKMGSMEDVFFKGSPALEAGIFNIGTKKGLTDLDVGYIMTGKSLPFNLGRIHISGYIGNAGSLKDSQGNVNNSGIMAGYDYGFWTVKSADGEYSRFVLAGDYSSGKNAIGGGGVGLYVYYTKNIDILSGPVWFNDRDLNGDWKWTTQLDINF